MLAVLLSWLRQALDVVTSRLVLKVELCPSRGEGGRKCLMVFCGLNLKWSDGLS